MSGLTKAMVAWLTTLEREGPSKRPQRSPIGYRALRKGYTDQVVTMPDGSTELFRSVEMGLAAGVVFTGLEDLTPAGRAALDAHREAGR